MHWACDFLTLGGKKKEEGRELGDHSGLVDNFLQIRDGESLHLNPRPYSYRNTGTS